MLERRVPFQVFFKRKLLKNIQKLPDLEQKKLKILIDDLRYHGPFVPQWPNFSKLSKDRYHCHLSRKWVACWEHINESLIIEVYFVGSRENAPY